jgi:hypothetical protein
MVTTLCFLDNVEKAFNEVNRILKNNGVFIVGIIDKDSTLGRLYEIKKKNSKFYKDARFYSVNEVTELLRLTGFQKLTIKQTLFSDMNLNMAHIEDGFGEGGFVAINTVKMSSNR